MDDSQIVVASESAEALDLIFGKPPEGVMNMGPKERQRMVKYWRKPDHKGATDAGWIAVGPDYGTDKPGHARYKELKRWKELPDRFGHEITHQPGSEMAWERTDAQRSEPVVWLKKFLAAGGLTYKIQLGDDFGTVGDWLMPAAQLVSLGFHRRDGILKLRPDLATAVDLECPNEGCTNDSDGMRRHFAGVTRAEAERALDNHMASHKGGEGARSAGREVQKVMEAMEAKGEKLDAQTIATIVASTIVALQQNQVVQVSTPEAKKYPDGKPDATWKRPQLMAWASANGVKYPPGGTKNTTEQWFEYLQKKGVTAA